MVSLLHALVFYGFVFYFLVNLVDVLEGFFAINARGGAWNPFNFAADIFTTAVLIGIVGLVLRRWLVKPKDFEFPPNVPLHPEVREGIVRDSTAGCWVYYLSRRLPVDFQGDTTGARRERTCISRSGRHLASAFAAVAPGGQEVLNHFFWWGALGSILLFIPYFPRSKHIHIFLRRSIWHSKRNGPGALNPMDFEKEEVFGAVKLEDFTWPRLLDSYSLHHVQSLPGRLSGDQYRQSFQSGGDFDQ